MSSYAVERAEFLLVMAAEGVPVEVAKRVLRWATTVQRFEVAKCNRPVSEFEREHADEAEQLILAAFKPYGLVADCSGDPRGHVTTVTLRSGRSNNMGGEAWGVPVRP